MLYSEAAYFDGAHVQHIADYQEHQRLTRLRKQAQKAAELQERGRRRSLRHDAPVHNRRQNGRAAPVLVHG